MTSNETLSSFSVRVIGGSCRKLCNRAANWRRHGSQKHVRPMAPSLMAQQVRANASKIAKAAFPRRS
jgi:hypothetical protein